jgi:hypothetical protein
LERSENWAASGKIEIVENEIIIERIKRRREKALRFSH